MAKKLKEKSAGRAAPARVTEPVYTMMAFITLVAIATGCALLYKDFDDYGQKQPPAEKIPALPKLGEEQKTGAPAPAAPAAPATPTPAAPATPAAPGAQGNPAAPTPMAN